MRTTTFLMLVCVMFATIFTAYQCSPAIDQKLVTASVDLLSCIDKNLNMTDEQIAIACGVSITPDLISLLSERKSVAAMKKSGNCVVIVSGYDAGGVGK